MELDENRRKWDEIDWKTKDKKRWKMSEISWEMKKEEVFPRLGFHEN